MNDPDLSSGAFSKEKAELFKRLLGQKGIQARAELTIPRRQEPGPRRLSFAQERLWFLDRLLRERMPGAPVYNLHASIHISGALNQAALEASLNEIVSRHEVLRTTFALVDHQPMQIVQPAERFHLPLTDLRSLPQPEREAETQRAITAQCQQPFDLSRLPLLRVMLLKLANDEHVMLCTMHHIISDAWSFDVMARELTALYRTFSSGRPSPLPALPIQYADYAEWQRERLEGELLESQLAYWRQRLSGLPSPPPLPAAVPQPAERLARGARKSFTLSPELTAAIKALGNRAGVTPFMLLLAAFKALIYRHTDCEDVMVGCDTANRPCVECESLIGFFINILVLRTNLSGAPSFRELLDRVRQVALGAFAHQETPFEKIVAALQPDRSSGLNPLIHTVFSFQNAPSSALELPGLTLRHLENGATVSRFDLTLFMWETPQGLAGAWRYNTARYDANSITSLADHFTTLLESLISQPDARINRLNMLTASELAEQASAQGKRQEAKRAKFLAVKPKPPKVMDTP